MDRFQSNGRLIAGVSFDIPGMGYKNPQTGAITGFEADLARAVGEKIFGSADRVDFSRSRTRNESRICRRVASISSRPS
jgi:ABC-type amino acid transport substrate-binding protein